MTASPLSETSAGPFRVKGLDCLPLLMGIAAALGAARLHEQCTVRVATKVLMGKV